MASQEKRKDAQQGAGTNATQKGVLILTVIVTVIVTVIGLSIIAMAYSGGSFYVSFATTGIVIFLLSLAIMSGLTYYSILPDPTGGNRRKSLILDKKEIRRSIAITFTILYILLISIYIHKIESATPAISTVYSFVNETVINKTANFSFSTVTILNETTNLTGNDLRGEGLTHLSSLITAFTTLYAIIIAFYFGSRVYEKIKEIKDAEDALKIQYIMDEIDKDEFRFKSGVLRGIKPNSELELSGSLVSTEKKVTIKHTGGDAICLKEIWVIIKVDKVKTKFGLATSDSKNDYFNVTEEMVINLEKGKVTVESIKIVIEEDTISADGVAKAWVLDKEVEVTVVYKQTNEIISPMGKETIAK